MQVHGPLSFSTFQDTFKSTAEKEAHLDEIIDKADAVSIDSLNPYISPPLEWDTYEQTKVLFEALSRLMLPDIGELKMAEILALKGLVKDELEPMRGEMLRLTTSLRSMLKDDSSVVAISREADNIIRTQVEPIIIEARRNITEHAHSKFKKWFAKGMGFLGWTGISLLQPSFSPNAITNGVALATDVLTESGDFRPPVASARAALRLDAYRNKGR